MGYIRRRQRTIINYSHSSSSSPSSTSSFSSSSPSSSSSSSSSVFVFFSFFFIYIVLHTCIYTSGGRHDARVDAGIECPASPTYSVSIPRICADVRNSTQCCIFDQRQMQSLRSISTRVLLQSVARFTPSATFATMNPGTTTNELLQHPDES